MIKTMRFVGASCRQVRVPDDSPPVAELNFEVKAAPPSEEFLDYLKRDLGLRYSQTEEVLELINELRFINVVVDARREGRSRE